MTHSPGDDGSVLTESQQALLSAVLDQVVPREGDLPGAGEMGVASHLDGVLARSLVLRRVFAQGLAAIEATSRSRESMDFADLTGDQKTAVLRDVESRHAEFFQVLVRNTYAGYYAVPAVVEALGLETRPPQPMGYRVDAFDSAVLETARKRSKLYREA